MITFLLEFCADIAEFAQTFTLEPTLKNLSQLGIVIYSKRSIGHRLFLDDPLMLENAERREGGGEEKEPLKKSVSLRSAPRVHTRYPIFLREEVLLGIVVTTTVCKDKRISFGD